MSSKKPDYFILTSEFPPMFGGGIGTYCYETAKMLSTRGYAVTVFTIDFTINLTTEKEEGNFKVVYFNPARSYTSSFLGYEANLSYAFAGVLGEYIEKNGKPAIIESQEYMGIAYFLLQRKHMGYSSFSGLKVLITLHAPSFLYLDYNRVPHFKLPYFWVGEMERFCIRAADMLISPSAYLIKALESRVELTDLDVQVVPNPYQVPQEPKELSYRKNEVVFFGKLTPQKGCLELIDYFIKLWNEGCTVPLTMIGGGDHMLHTEQQDMIDFIRKKYKKEIQQEKIRLLGSLPFEKAAPYLKNAHVVLIPSVIDNLPYTLLEAMGQGKVVLASKQGGQSEVITDGEDGFLFDHETENSFSERLQQILSLPSESIERIGQRAMDKIKNTFSYSAVFEQKEKYLKAFLASSTGGKLFPLTRHYHHSSPAALSIKDGSLLSVVIPFYNMGEYIEACVRSVLASTYKSIEIIIIDDGSDSYHSEILNQLAARMPVVIVQKENGGLASARNTGAMHAGGELLAFLDPDDTIEPTYYEKAIRVLSQYENVYFVGCWARYFGNSSGYWPAFNPEPPYLLIHNMINSSALIYKKQAFLNAGLNDKRMIYGMEDYESVIHMVSKGYHGVALPEPLWNYRVRKNSMARRFTKNKQIYLYRLIAEKHASFFSNFTSDLVNLLNANGPGYAYDNPTVFHTGFRSKLLNGKLRSMVVNLVKSNPFFRKIIIYVKSRV